MGGFLSAGLNWLLAKNYPRAIGVIGDLIFKGVKAFKFFLGADKAAKAYIKSLSVNISVEIKNIDFEPRFLAANSRAVARIGHARAPASLAV